MLRIINQKTLAWLLALLAILSFSACTNDDLNNNQPSGKTDAGAQPLALKIAHFNDSHAQIEANSLSINFALDPAAPQTLTSVQTLVGGFPRLTAKVKALREAAGANFLMLDAGDVFMGTLYFTLYQGLADLSFLNDNLKIDAMCLGNHEFDKGPSSLATFLKQAKFPALGSNVDASTEPDLKDIVLPYKIVEVSGQQVALIGLTTPEVVFNSSPGDNLKFAEAKDALNKVIPEITSQGVNKIIVLSHLGYEADVALAEEVPAVDAIVGGHSHTLLGSDGLKQLGQTPTAAYPTISGPTSKSICVVQAWEKTKVLGMLDLEFDAAGNVTKCAGQPVMLFADSFKKKIKDPNDATKEITVDLSESEKAQVLKTISDSGVAEVINDDTEAAAKLATYSAEVKQKGSEKVATVSEDLLQVREPNTTHKTNVAMPRGSEIAPVIAEGMIWKMKQIGQDVQMSLVNAGGARVDILKGDLSVSRCYELQPFGNTFYLLKVTGAEMKTLLEDLMKETALRLAKTPSDNNFGGFPYVSGIRYTADMNQGDGSRITKLEIKENGTWKTLSPTTTYTLVTNNYAASGKDGYTVLGQVKTFRLDTGIVDAEAFIEYAKAKGTLSKTAADTGVTFIPKK